MFSFFFLENLGILELKNKIKKCTENLEYIETQLSKTSWRMKAKS